MHPWWFFTGFLPSTVVPENWWSLYSKAAAIEVVHFVKRVKVLVHFFAETFWIFMEGNFFSNAVGNPPRNRSFSTQVAPILGELRIWIFPLFPSCLRWWLTWLSTVGSRSFIWKCVWGTTHRQPQLGWLLLGCTCFLTHLQAQGCLLNKLPDSCQIYVLYYVFNVDDVATCIQHDITHTLEALRIFCSLFNFLLDLTLSPSEKRDATKATSKGTGFTRSQDYLMLRCPLGVFDCTKINKIKQQSL